MLVEVKQAVRYVTMRQLNEVVVAGKASQLPAEVAGSHLYTHCTAKL